MVTFIIICSLTLFLVALREYFIAVFKISYYETTLDLQGVDISEIKKIGIVGIIKL